MIEIQITYMACFEKCLVTIDLPEGVEYREFNSKKQALRYVISRCSEWDDELVGLEVQRDKPPRLTGGSPE